ncbi:MAG: tetratricopeptide repeat protein [Planctomycetota bacterium]
MNPHTARAQLLLQQKRYDQAAESLRRALGEHPDDPIAHAWLGVALSETGDVPGAKASLGEAIRLAPDHHYPHFVLGHVYLDEKKLIDARRAADEAIRLAPEEPGPFALRAQIEASSGNWEDALGWAERGLERDPEHTGLGNLRGMALTQLGRRREAGEAVDRNLQADPEDPMSHANRGWQRLHAGRAREALDCFREALRLEPGHEWAKAGLVEALKARNPIYRFLLGYILWMARLDGRTRFWLILGGYLAYRGMLVVSRESPGLRPLLWPVIGAYLAFVLLTWVGVPLFNLLVRLNPHGRHALDKWSRISSNAFGGFLLAGLIVAGVGLATASVMAYASAVYLGVLAVTSGLSLLHDGPADRRNHLIAAGVNAAAGAGALACIAVDNLGAFTTLAAVFWLSLLVFMFIPAKGQ